MVGSLFGSQAQYNNWSQGGINSISITASEVFKAKYTASKFSYTNSINLKYGQTNIEGQGVRKTDDLIEILNQFDFFLRDKRWSAFASINFRTQFDDGFDFGTDPETKISEFFAPAYFLESAGMSFEPVPYFKAQAGLALKQTIVRDTTLSTLYGVKAGEKFRSEGGLTIALNFNKEIAKNVTYINRTETFTNLLIPVSSTDVVFYNELNGKINEVLNANVQFVLAYDDDFSNQVQLKQIIAVGLSIKFI